MSASLLLLTQDMLYNMENLDYSADVQALRVEAIVLGMIKIAKGVAFAPIREELWDNVNCLRLMA